MNKSLLFAFIPLIACGSKKAAAPAAPDVCKDFGGSAGFSIATGTDWRECAIRTEESLAGNLMADSAWWASQDNHFSADVTTASKSALFYVNNSGDAQLKINLAAGEVCATGYKSKTPALDAAGKSFGETMFGFHDTHFIVTMTKANVKKLLERSFAQVQNFNGTPREAYPNLGGSFLVVSNNVEIDVDFTDYATKAQQVKNGTLTDPSSCTADTDCAPGHSCQSGKCAAIACDASTATAGCDGKTSCQSTCPTSPGAGSSCSINATTPSASTCSPKSAPSTTVSGRDGALITAIKINGKDILSDDSVTTVTFLTTNFVAGLNVSATGTTSVGGGYATGFISDAIVDPSTTITAVQPGVSGTAADGTANQAAFTDETSLISYLTKNTPVTPTITPPRYKYAHADANNGTVPIQSLLNGAACQ